MPRKNKAIIAVFIGLLAVCGQVLAADKCDGLRARLRELSDYYDTLNKEFMKLPNRDVFAAPGNNIRAKQKQIRADMDGVKKQLKQCEASNGGSYTQMDSTPVTPRSGERQGIGDGGVHQMLIPSDRNRNEEFRQEQLKKERARQAERYPPSIVGSWRGVYDNGNKFTVEFFGDGTGRAVGRNDQDVEWTTDGRNVYLRLLGFQKLLTLRVGNNFMEGTHPDVGHLSLEKRR